MRFNITYMVSGHSAECSSTVSENKSLTMLLVCIQTDIVHAPPYFPTSSFHI